MNEPVDFFVTGGVVPVVPGRKREDKPGVVTQLRRGDRRGAYPNVFGLHLHPLGGREDHDGQVFIGRGSCPQRVAELDDRAVVDQAAGAPRIVVSFPFVGDDGVALPAIWQRNAKPVLGVFVHHGVSPGRAQTSEHDDHESERCVFFHGGILPCVSSTR